MLSHLRKTLRQFLVKRGWYAYLRHSALFRFLLKWRNPGYLQSLENDQAFYRQLLGQDRVPLIFDVGANVGDKAHVFAQLADRVICFEPDPRLARDLRIRFRHQPQMVIVQAAVSNREGTLPLHTYDDGSAYNTLNAKQHDHAISLHQTHQVIEVPVTTLTAAIHQYGLPDFLKVDVEGHELEVFSSLTQLPPMLSFEANLPAFQNETLHIIDHLERLAPNLRFGVFTGKGQMHISFPFCSSTLKSLILSPDCPGFMEIFVRHAVVKVRLV
jgi:FkbM family methyltransferase